MFTNVLVAVEKLNSRNAAIDLATGIAKATGAQVTVAHVLRLDDIQRPPDSLTETPSMDATASASPFAWGGSQVAMRGVVAGAESRPRHEHHGGIGAELIEEHRQALETRILGLTSDSRNEGVTFKTDVLVGEPDQEIRSTLENGDYDLVVLATNRASSVARAMFGSTTDRIIHGLNIPALVINIHGEYAPDVSVQAPTDLIVPLNGEPESEVAIDLVSRLGESLKADVHLLMAVDAELGSGTRQWAEGYLQDIQSNLKTAGISASAHVFAGSAVTGITNLARQSANPVVVLKRSDRTGIPRFLFGSFPDQLVRHSHLPVLLAPPR